MQGLLTAFGTVTLLGAIVGGIALFALGMPAVGAGALFGGLTTAVLWFALTRILDRLDEMRAELKRLERA